MSLLSVHCMPPAVVVVFCVVYVYACVMATLVWGFFWWRAGTSTFSLLHTLCMYGYSLSGYNLFLVSLKAGAQPKDNDRCVYVYTCVESVYHLMCSIVPIHTVHKVNSHSLYVCSVMSRLIVCSGLPNTVTTLDRFHCTVS